MSRLNLIIFTLFFLIFPIKASEQVNSSDVFFTLYFVDGSSRSFYSGDIEEISFSEIDNNGVRHNDFVVQEYKLKDNCTERYLISDIIEISFDNVALLFDPVQFDSTWRSVENSVERILDNVKYFSELKSYTEDLKSIKDVSNVFIDDNKLIVTLNDGSSQFWNVFIEPGISDMSGLSHSSKLISIGAGNNGEGHLTSPSRNVLLFNQTFEDSGYSDINKSIAAMGNILQESGFNVDIKTNEWRTFNNLGRYDINILYTHGCYGLGKHWLLTGIKASYTEQCNLPEYGKYWVKTKDLNSKNQYCMVNEDYIADYCKNLKENIVFTSACQALENDNGLADAFLNNGAKVFIGYDGENTVGHMAANQFLKNLCEDKTVLEALRELPDDLKIDKSGARLHAIKKNKTELDELNVCFWPHGVTISTLPKYESSGGGKNFKFGFQINGLSKLKGFEYEIGIALGGFAEEPEIHWLKCEDIKDGVNYVTSPSLTGGRTYTYLAYLKLNGETYYDEDFFEYCSTKLNNPPYVVVPGTPPTMYDFLSRLYVETNGEKWKWNDYEKCKGSWMWMAETKVSEWYGVTEVGPNLYDIDLNNENIVGKVNFDNCPFIRNIDLSNNKIQYLSFKNCRNIENIECYDNLLGSIDIQNCPKLLTANFNVNNLKRISLLNCPKFNDLYVEDNNLERINIPISQPIKSLYCSQNKIASIDFSGNSYIEYIECDENPVKNINVSQCKNLSSIYFNRYDYKDMIADEINLSHSGIESIDCCVQTKKLIANNCRNLKKFENIESKSPLSILDLSDCDELATVRVYDKNLIYLDLSGCSSLEVLNCWGQLTFLDVTGCRSLETISCKDNSLTQIIHGSLPNLRKLICSNNKITSLDWYAFPDLNYLDCINNPITSEIPYNAEDGIYFYDKRYEYVKEYIDNEYQYVTIDKGIGIWLKGEPYYPVLNKKTSETQ